MRSAIDLAMKVLVDLARGGDGPQAIRHPLGFFCLPVVRDDGFGICVHGWDVEREPVDAPPHSHSWDLTSHVLYGTVVNVRFDVADEPVDVDSSPGATGRIYIVDSHRDHDELRASPRTVRWSLRDRRGAGPGAEYTLSAGEFHTTAVRLGTAAATVVVARPVPAARDLIIAATSGTSSEVIRPRCSPAETGALARLLLDNRSVLR
jgi:hypothetical protein